MTRPERVARGISVVNSDSLFRQEVQPADPAPEPNAPWSRVAYLVGNGSAASESPRTRSLQEELLRAHAGPQALHAPERTATPTNGVTRRQISEVLAAGRSAVQSNRSKGSGERTGSLQRQIRRGQGR